MTTTLERSARLCAKTSGDARGWRTDEVGLFDVNFDTGECYWSRELRHIIGIDVDAPAELSLFLARVHPEDRRAVAATCVEPFRPDCPPHTRSEFRVLQEDGSVRWVHVERVTIYRPAPEHDVVRVAGFLVEIDEPAPIRPLRFATWGAQKFALLLFSLALLCSSCARDSSDDQPHRSHHHAGHGFGRHGGFHRANDSSPTPSPF